MATQRIWLTPEEQRAWRALLEATQLLFDVLERQLVRDADLSHADYEILVHLSEAPGRRVRMSELAERTLYSKSRLSHAVARLEQLGWVERAPSPADRRGTIATLTDAGFEKLKLSAPGHARKVRQVVFDNLDAEQVAALHAIASTIRDAAKRS